MIENKNCVIHFVGGKQLSPQEYSQHRYNSGADDMRDFISTQIKAINNNVKDDGTFRQVILKELT